MRFLLMAQVLPLMLVSVLQTCNEENVEPPVIDEVYFPDTLEGDGSVGEGYVLFSDADAGVRYAVLESLECPAQWTCVSGTIDLKSVDPGIPYDTEGAFGFTMTCDNTTSVDVDFVYSWTLIDTGGNESQPVEFAHTCLGTSTDTVPEITSVDFPSEINGNGATNTGLLEFEDDNAGVRYAYLEPVSCPGGWSCESNTIDLTEVDPDFDEYYWGNFSFGLRCTNTETEAVSFEYSWTLEDIEGNVSTPYSFGFSCLPIQGIIADGAVSSGRIELQSQSPVWSDGMAEGLGRSMLVR